MISSLREHEQSAPKIINVYDIYNLWLEKMHIAFLSQPFVRKSTPLHSSNAKVALRQVKSYKKRFLMKN